MIPQCKAWDARDVSLLCHYQHAFPNTCPIICSHESLFIGVLRPDERAHVPPQQSERGEHRAWEILLEVEGPEKAEKDRLAMLTSLSKERRDYQIQARNHGHRPALAKGLLGKNNTQTNPLGKAKDKEERAKKIEARRTAREKLKAQGVHPELRNKGQPTWKQRQQQQQLEQEMEKENIDGNGGSRQTIVPIVTVRKSRRQLLGPVLGDRNPAPAHNRQPHTGNTQEGGAPQKRRAGLSSASGGGLASLQGASSQKQAANVGKAAGAAAGKGKHFGVVRSMYRDPFVPAKPTKHPWENWSAMNESLHPMVMSPTVECPIVDDPRNRTDRQVLKEQHKMQSAWDAVSTVWLGANGGVKKEVELTNDERDQAAERIRLSSSSSSSSGNSSGRGSSRSRRSSTGSTGGEAAGATGTVAEAMAVAAATKAANASAAAAVFEKERDEAVITAAATLSSSELATILCKDVQGYQHRSSRRKRERHRRAKTAEQQPGRGLLQRSKFIKCLPRPATSSSGSSLMRSMDIAASWCSPKPSRRQASSGEGSAKENNGRDGDCGTLEPIPRRTEYTASSLFSEGVSFGMRIDFEKRPPAYRLPGLEYDSDRDDEPDDDVRLAKNPLILIRQGVRAK